MAKRRDGRAGEMYVALGAALQELRESKSLNQEGLALQVGLSRASIANIEGGRQAVSLHHLADMAAALGTTASAIIRIVESKPKATEQMPEDLPTPVMAFVRNRLRLAP